MEHIDTGMPSKKNILLLIVLFFLIASFGYLFLKDIEKKKEDALVEPVKPNIIAIGDSLTEGYEVEKPYPEILGEFLQTDVKNCGIGGIRVSEISSNIDGCVEEDTDIVIFWGGANDLKYSTSLEDMVSEFEYAMKKISNKEIIVLTIPPNIEIGEENQVLRKELNEYLRGVDGITVIDIYEVLRDKDNENKMLDKYHLKGVHLNQLGYYVVANMVYREITEIYY